VIDIGAGCGVVRAELERTFPFAVDCADIDLRALSAASPGRGRTMFYDITERHGALVGKYDVIFLLDVLEHIDPTRPFAEAIVDHMAPGSVLIVNVPAMEWARSRFDDAVGHHRRYSKATLRAEFEELGLRVLDQRYWGLGLLPVLVARSVMLRFVPKDRVVTSGFKPPNRLANAVLTAWMRMETTLLPSPPVGSSVLMAFSLERPPDFHLDRAATTTLTPRSGGSRGVGAGGDHSEPLLPTQDRVFKGDERESRDRDRHTESNCVPDRRGDARRH
jgi:2-polyprenyl-3-methyl-5-hydroxy-6-metoxy-1,4-benzoquinol methylase